MASVITVTLSPAVDRTLGIPPLCRGGLNRVQTLRTDPGGKGINVSRLLQKFGTPTVAAGLVAGSAGDWLEATLAQAGVAASFVRTEGETRTNIKLREPDGTVTEINAPGLPVSDADKAAFERQLDTLLTDASLLVLGGSLPPGLTPDYYAFLIRRAKAAGVPTVLDADGERLKEGLKAAPFAVKPNLPELQELTGMTLDDEAAQCAALRELRRQGVTLAIVSRGADGALFAGSDGIFAARPFPVVCRGTVGAGDSLVAGLCHGLTAGMPLRETAALATATGTLSVACEGTELCDPADVFARKGDVTVTKLA